MTEQPYTPTPSASQPEQMIMSDNGSNRNTNHSLIRPPSAPQDDNHPIQPGLLGPNSPNQLSLIPPDSPSAEKSIVIYQPPDEARALELTADVEHNTVWVTQKQIAYALGLKVPTVNYHIHNFKKGRQGATESVIRHLLITADDGKTYRVEHYHMTVVAYVGFNAKATEQVIAFQDWVGKALENLIARQHAKLASLPTQTTISKDLKTIHRATDSGYSWAEGKERVIARQELAKTNSRLAGIRKGYGVKTSKQYAMLNGIDFCNGVLMSREEWKRQHGIKGDALDYLSTLDVISLIHAKECAADKYAQRNPQTYSELIEVGKDIHEECERFHRILSRILPGRFLQPPTESEQKKLKDG